ncbi:MAG TPA: cellulase family glycosylhydrolase, partial [Stellaceae bacterium]|nr:cellulase family glycosylhydrolase [Stellaceae bacterium]
MRSANRRAGGIAAAALALVVAMLWSAGLPAATAQNAAAATTEGSVGVVIALRGGGPPPLTFVAVSSPRGGAALLAGPLAAYTPAPHFSGGDAFRYKVVDAAGNSSPPATVRITVKPFTAAAANPPHVTISGKRLVDANGRPFTVKGLIARPLIAPFFQDILPFRHFGGAELAAAQRWGANTIRLLASQPMLDPQSPLYSKQYILSVENAAQQVLDEGFVLIIGVNDEPSTGETVPNCLPTEATERAWNTLLALPFAQRRYAHQVMLEPFNEPVSGFSPGAGPDASWWRVWQNGGDVAPFRVGPNLNCAGGVKIGMNQLVAQIRQAGATNIVLADGLGWAHWLNPQFPLTDPGHRLAYAAHPFLENWQNFHLVGDPSLDYPLLDGAFGDMRQRGPLVVTAIGGGAESTGLGCQPQAPRIMPVLLRYLRQRGIGVVG